MKINVRKMQEGGTMGSSAQAYGFLDYMPFISQPTQSRGTSEVAAPQQGQQPAAILSDDMIKALMGKGLTNDVNAFLGSVNELYSNPLESNPFGSSLNSSDLARRQLTLISRINEIQNNKDLFTKAVDSARNSGGLNELAITSFGRIMAVDNENGGVKQITPQELYKNRAGYTPLTNAQIAEMRMNNPSLAFDTNIFNTIENAVGSKQVDEFIRTAINSANSMTNENNQFRSKEELAEVQRGLKLLQDGVYKEKRLTQTNVNQINSAVNYLYKALPSNYRMFLEAKAAEMGVDPRKGMADLIGDYAGSRYDIKTTRDIDYDKAATKGAGEGADKTKFENTPLMALYNGVGAQRKQVVFNYGDQFSSKVTGLHLNAIPDQSGKIIPANTNLQKIIDESLGFVSNVDNIYMGGQKIRPSDLRKMIYTSGGITSIDVPINNDGTPNFDLLKQYSKANEEIQSKGLEGNPEEIKRIFEENGLATYVTPSGEVDNSRFKKYFVINGAASTEQDVLSDDVVTSGMVKPIKQEYDSRGARKDFQRDFRAATTDTNTGISYNPGDDIYFGTVFIEDNGSLINAAMSGKNYVKFQNRDPYEQVALGQTEEEYSPAKSDKLGI